MNKTLLSVITAAGLMASGSALADTSLVEVYGTLNVDFENVQAKSATVPLPAAGIGQLGSAGAGAAAPSRNRVTSNSSNIGFRGKEDLGMGWNAIFQIETGIAMDSASGVAATNTQSTGFLGTRNTNVGLSSQKFGTVFYGNWDTPYKALTNTLAFDPFYATGIASGNAIIGTPGFAVATTTAGGRATVLGAAAAVSNDASFDRRQGNSVQYWTPNIFGFSGRLVYSANEQRSPETPAVPTVNINPAIYGASLIYEYGPFRATGAWEQHRDYFGLAVMGGAASLPVAADNTSRDNGYKATLSYKLFGTTTANVMWERLSYNNSDTVAGHLIHYHRDAIYFSLLHQIGAGTIRLGFGDAHQGSCDRAGGAIPAPCSTTGLDARQYSVGYSYSFSKRTDLYAFWTAINNGSFATYQLGNGAGIGTAQSGATGAGGGAGGGSHNQGFGLGIRHVF
ncbi:MAG TPA: porin [Burkholderiales bacterium]|nr:porin [Burkholderiales bacterium]